MGIFILEEGIQDQGKSDTHIFCEWAQTEHLKEFLQTNRLIVEMYEVLE
jgi:hypothetical protein